MNSRMRNRLFPEISTRYGEVCKICGVRGNKQTLEIDHKNNDNSDNRMENLQLLCRRCNYLKDQRKKPVDNMCVNVCEDERPLPPEMVENRRMEPMFRRWFFYKVLAEGKITYEEALNAGAEYTGSSTETIKRYLRKMTSSEGKYENRNDANGYPYIIFKDS